MKQKDIFLQGEADARFQRNFGGLAQPALADDDPILRELLEIRDAGLLGARLCE